MSLTSEFQRMREELDACSKDRMLFVDRVKSDVERLRDDAVATMHETREALAETARRDRAARQGSVAALRDDVTRQMAGNRKDLQEKAAQDRAGRADFMLDLRQATGDVLEEARAFLAEAHLTRGETDRLSHKDRLAFAANLRGKVEELLATTEKDLAEASRLGRAERAAFLGSLQISVASLRAETQETMSRIRNEQGVASRQGRERRAEHIAALANELGTLLDNFRSLRQAFSRDLAGARAAYRREQLTVKIEVADPWTATPPPAEAQRPEPPKPTAAPAREVPHPQPEISDDLTVILGIGSGMQNRLNDLGIRSFRQLAQNSTETLREMLGNIGRMADIGSWIEQAQDLISQDD